jgi:hypothetical protein
LRLTSRQNLGQAKAIAFAGMQFPNRFSNSARTPQHDPFLKSRWPYAAAKP